MRRRFSFWRPAGRLALLLLPLAAAAQPTITGLSPTRNLRNAARASSVAVTFSQPMNGAASSVSALKVFSQQRGGRMSGAQGGAATVSGNTITFNPTTDFKPGETVMTTVTTAAQSSGGGSLAAGHVHQFTAAAGAGPGTFSGGSDPAVGSVPYSVTIGDVDGDGDLDLLTANINTNTVSVRLNDGSGTFSGGSDPAVGTTPYSMAVGDVDGDGDLDLLTTNTNTNTVSVRFNNGSGTFSGGSDPAVGTGPYSVAVGDVDGDGDLDLLTANITANTVSVRLNDGSGTFSGGSDPAVGIVPYSVAVGDVDGDGDLDLLTANIAANTVSVRLNDGSGTFSGGSDPAVGSAPYSVAVGDVDGDGDLDLLTANNGAATVSVRLNDGSGTFSGGTDPAVSNGPRSVAVGDVDGDGDLDLLTANSTNIGFGSVSVRLNDGTGTFGGGADLGAGDSPDSAVLADVDGDGDLDLLAANKGANTVSVRLNQVPDLIVSTTQTISGTYNTVTITATGTATLSGPLTVNTALTVQTGGRLNTACQPLTGAGTFTLQTGATLGICSAAGISASGPTGAVQVTGARSFASDATYIYNGTAAQITGNGLPPTVRELETASPVGVTLTQPVGVTQAVRLTAGTLATGGQLTLLSTTTRTAYAVHAGGLTSGTVVVQRYVGGPATVSYRHLSSPVQAAPVSDLTTVGFTAKVNPAYNNLPYVAPPAATFPNVLGYDETRGGLTPAYVGFGTGYFSPATLGTTLTPGRGYSVYMPGGKTPDFVGALTTGNVAQTLSLTGTNSNPNIQKAGWHLLGNPYPQPIDWDLATVPSGMDVSISVYRTTGGTTGAYLTRASGIGSLPDGILPLGQAFFARATAATSFTFTNALRVEANPATVARPTPEARPVLNLTLTDTHGQGDATFVYAQADATAQADARFDGFKPGRNVGVPTLATLINGQEAAVNGLPETVLTQPTTVELLAVLPTTGTYTLAVGQFSNFGGTSVELLDRLTGTRYDLAQQPTITLTATRANEEVTGRFALLLNGQRITGDNSSFLIPNSSFTLFPNPARGQVRITGATGAVELLDSTGRVVRRISAGAELLEVAGLPAGMYLVRCGGATQRLVVE